MEEDGGGVLSWSKKKKKDFYELKKKRRNHPLVVVTSWCWVFVFFRVLFFFGLGAEALGHVVYCLLGAVLVAVVAAAGVKRNAYWCCARP